MRVTVAVAKCFFANLDNADVGGANNAHKREAPRPKSHAQAIWHVPKVRADNSKRKSMLWL